jgi:hypothetical protein
MLQGGALAAGTFMPWWLTGGQLCPNFYFILGLHWCIIFGWVS